MVGPTALLSAVSQPQRQLVITRLPIAGGVGNLSHAQRLSACWECLLCPCGQQVPCPLTGFCSSGLTVGISVSDRLRDLCQPSVL